MAPTLAQIPLADGQEAKAQLFSLTDVAQFDEETLETCGSTTRLLAAIIALHCRRAMYLRAGRVSILWSP